MKKSKIIIPALAMIAFSVVASITGTVAWFTAQRTATINAGTYAVVKTTSDLTAVLTGGAATTVDTEDDHKINFSGDLTHGSFDHTSGDIRIPNEAGKGIKGHVAAASATASDLLMGTNPANSKSVYTAATFHIAFTLTWNSSSNNVGLYLDTSASSFTTSGTTSAKAFRLALYPESGSNTVARVFADLQTSSNCYYIASDSANLTGANGGGTAYSGKYLIDSSINRATPATPATTDSSNYEECLGYFAYASATGTTTKSLTLTFTAVAWFEGTDPNITDSTTVFDSVTANLQFEAKTIL